MYLEDEFKNVFLTSLSDQQMGFFYAHENDEDLEELLCDEITPIQMGLFKKWKDNKESDTTTMQSTYLESIANGKTSTSFQPPKIPTAAPPNMQETDLRELKRYMDLQIESKVNDVRKEMQTQRIINFEESTQTEQLEELGEIQQLQRKLSLLEKRCEDVEKENLSLKQKNEKVTTELNDYMRKQEPVTTCNVCPKCEEKNTTQMKNGKNCSKSTNSSRIKDISPAAKEKAMKQVSEQSDPALFRDRQGSYTRIMKKEHIGNELNLQTDAQSSLNKLREEGKSRISHCDSAAYGLSDVANHTIELNQDKKELLANEVDDLYKQQNLSNNQHEPDEPNNPDNSFVDLGAETPITTKHLKELKDKVLERLPAEVNILLLGESGVGKSTFLSSACNYLLYNSPEEAFSNGVQLLSPVNYIIYDNERNPIEISEGPDGSTTLNVDERTTNPQIHEFLTVLPNGVMKLIRLLDTPGVGDEEGMEADKLNLSKTMEKLHKFKHINAICILMPANQARMNTMFRYCINELLTQLDKSAKNNIFFCFTSSRQTMYRFEETATLQRIFNEWKIDIPVNIDNAFCFDNECVKYLLAKKKGMHFLENEESEYKLSWNKSSVAAFKFLDKVAETNPVNINNTLNLNETRKYLERISMPLAEIIRLYVTNKQLLERKLKMVSKYSSNITSSVLAKPNYILEVRLLDRPQMVCTSAKCTKTSRDRTQHNVCHRGCIVRQPHSRISHPELEFCREIQNGYCKKCDCSWQEHMHQTEIYVTKEGKAPQRCGSKPDEKKAFEKEIRVIEMEIDTILTSCARFSFFIARESMFGGHDMFREAMDQVIREVSVVKYAVDSFIRSKESKYSQSSLDETKESKLLQELINKKILYQQSLAGNQKKTVDVDTIADTIETLKQLPSWKSVVDATENNFKRYNDEILSKETEHGRF